jgi:hypothetical protein
VTIAVRDEDNPTDRRGRPTIQVETEANEKAVYLRGISLTKDPNYPAAGVTEQERGPVTIHVTWPKRGPSDTGSKTLHAVVVERSLGPEGPMGRIVDIDHNLNVVGNYYGIPPQFLKAQVETESSFEHKKYRYEPISIDFKVLTGDGTVTENGKATVWWNPGPNQQRYIRRYPYREYAIGTRLLEGNATPTDLSQTAEGTPEGVSTVLLTLADGKTRLPYGVRYGTDHPRKKLRARIKVDLNGQRWTEVIDRRHWRKARREGNGDFEDPQTVCGTCYAVDYDTGTLRLGTPLGVKKDGDKVVFRDQLTVSFQPVEVDATEVASGTHYINSPATWESTSNPGGVLSKGLKDRTIEYQPGWSLTEWFGENMRVRPGGRWLVADTGEFEVDFDASSAPKMPLDPRFSPIRAQFFAAASYGPLQLTLGEWETSAKRALLDRVLAVDQEPLYRANDPAEWARGVALGAVVHLANLRATLGLPPGAPDPVAPCSACTQLKWEGLWSRVFHRYNPDKHDKYGYPGKPCPVIMKGRKFEPY